MAHLRRSVGLAEKRNDEGGSCQVTWRRVSLCLPRISSAQLHPFARHHGIPFAIQPWVVAGCSCTFFHNGLHSVLLSLCFDHPQGRGRDLELDRDRDGVDSLQRRSYLCAEDSQLNHIIFSPYLLT